MLKKKRNTKVGIIKSINVGRNYKKELKLVKTILSWRIYLN